MSDTLLGGSSVAPMARARWTVTSGSAVTVAAFNGAVMAMPVNAASQCPAAQYLNPVQAGLHTDARTVIATSAESSAVSAECALRL